MSKKEEKDQVFFVDEEDQKDVVEEREQEPLRPDVGEAVGPDGEIDWDCPCLQGMADGPCGDAFKEAFSCFVYSEAEDKGSDCIEHFQSMHECLQENAEYYENLQKERKEEAEKPSNDEADKASEPEKEGES